VPNPIPPPAPTIAFSVVAQHKPIVLLPVGVHHTVVCLCVWCRGLSLFLAATPQWVYKRDMLSGFAFEATLAELKKKCVFFSALSALPSPVDVMCVWAPGLLHVQVLLPVFLHSASDSCSL
jgi:hypothetical protein